MKIGFTGTQQGMNNCQLIVLKQLIDKATKFHHGCCIGADKQAHDIAKSRNIYIITHPPINTSKIADCYNADEVRLPKDYLVRNHDIVDETEILIATPKELNEQLRSGTWATIRYAIRTGKPVIIITIQGKVNKR